MPIPAKFTCEGVRNEIARKLHEMRRQISEWYWSPSLILHFRYYLWLYWAHFKTTSSWMGHNKQTHATLCHASGGAHPFLCCALLNLWCSLNFTCVLGHFTTWQRQGSWKGFRNRKATQTDYSGIFVNCQKILFVFSLGRQIFRSVAFCIGHRHHNPFFSASIFEWTRRSFCCWMNKLCSSANQYPDSDPQINGRNPDTC